MSLYDRLICLERGFLTNSEGLILMSAKEGIFFDQSSVGYIPHINPKILESCSYELIEESVDTAKRWKSDTEYHPLIEKWDLGIPLSDSFQETGRDGAKFHELVFDQIFPIKQTIGSRIYHKIFPAYCPTFILDHSDNWEKIEYLDSIIDHLKELKN